MPSNQLSGFSTTVTFPSAPSNHATNTIKAQPNDFSLGGTFYMYDRGITTVRHRLTYKKVSYATLQLLLSGFKNANGSRSGFNWYDQNAAYHWVKFIGGIDHVEYAPDKYSVSFTLEETV